MLGWQKKVTDYETIPKRKLTSEKKAVTATR